MLFSCSLIFFFVWGLTFLLGQTLGFAQGLGDDPLQLAVGAAELVRSPGLYRVHRLSVYTQDEILGFLLCHKGLMVECTSINYGLSTVVTTENDEQIADHRSLLVVVEVNDLFA